MLVELLHCFTSLPLDYYKEIITSYRHITDELSIREIENCIELYSNADRLFQK